MNISRWVAHSVTSQQHLELPGDVEIQYLLRFDPCVTIVLTSSWKGKRMINNILEMWYWTLMLGAFIGFAIYYSYHFLRDLWAAFKKRVADSDM